MMKIVTGCWGDKYPDSYKDKFLENIDRGARGYGSWSVEFIEDQHAMHPGWWNKLRLFEPGRFQRHCMWIDIDTVVTGSLEPIWTAYARGDLFAAPLNWAQSGHGGIQSSLMIWNADKDYGIWKAYNADPISWQKGLHGDQEFLTHLRDTGRLKLTAVAPTLIRSYKYHARHAVPEGASLVTFHGNPKPHEAGGWVRDYW